MSDKLVLNTSELTFGNSTSAPVHTFSTHENGNVSFVQDNGNIFDFSMRGNFIVSNNLQVKGTFDIGDLQIDSATLSNVSASTRAVLPTNTTIGNSKTFSVQGSTMILGNHMTIQSNSSLTTVNGTLAANTMIVDGLDVKQGIVNGFASASSIVRYFVKTNGSDAEDGRSWGRAFATIKHAANVALSGSTIYVESGTYTENNPIRLRPRVALVGDNLRQCILKAVNPKLDYFHLDSLCYLTGLRFLDLQRPAFCCAFPCAIAEATIQNGAVSTIALLYSPTGYTSAPPVIIEAPENLAGVQATATAILSGGVITGFTITNPGSGYGTQRPHVSIPAASRPFVSGSPYIQNCSSITGPFNKQSPPAKISEFTPLPYSTTDVDLEGAGGGCRVDGAVCSRGIVGSVTMTSGGFGYTSPPTVQFSDGDAVGTAVLSGSSVVSVTITNGGSYVNIPTVKFLGGGGTGAQGTVVMSLPPSPLRSFVTDSFTQVNQGGPGHLVINLGYAQFVSCFTTFCSYSFKAVAGGFTNISTSVTDFGTYGLVSSGYWPIPIASGSISQRYRSTVTSITITDSGSGVGGSGYLTAPLVLFSSAGSDEIRQVASDGLAGDAYGQTVSMSGDGTRYAVGAPNKASSILTAAGAVYVYVLSGSTWTEEAKILAPTPEANVQFGSRLRMSNDGTRLLISSYGDQKTFVYSRSGSIWQYEAELSAGDKSPGDTFGYSLSITADGSRAAVGAPNQDPSGISNAGAVYIFSRSGTTWTEEAKLTASDKIANAGFGESASIASTSGALVIIGAHKDNPTGNPGTLDAGSCYVFTRSSTTWTQSQKITAPDAAPSDFFGSSVSVSADGTRAAFGAPFRNFAGVTPVSDAGAVYVYYNNSGTWTYEATLVPSEKSASDNFGYGVFMNSDGSRIVSGSKTASTSGVAYLYIRVLTTWNQYDTFVASDKVGADAFGYRGVTSNAAGTRVVVGAENWTSGKGKAYVYTMSTPAAGTAVLFVDRVNSVIITDPGSYKNTPTIQFIGGGGSGASGSVKLQAPVIILTDVSRGRKPDVGSVVKYNGTWYTVTGASLTATATYNITFYPPIYSTEQGDIVYFHIASQVSTGGHVTEYLGAGITYNALPEYGGVPNAGNKYVEITPGKVYFNISDHLGNQDIGKYFSVDQLTGAVTIKTDQFSLSGLVGISFDRGGSIKEVSNDPNLVSSTGAPDSVTVATQYAVYTYVNQRTLPAAGNVGEALVKYTSSDFNASWQAVVLTNQKNTANGVAGLDNSSRIPTGLLPVTANVGNVYVASGSAGAPGYAFAEYSDTGVYNDTGALCVSTAGTSRLRITPAGNVGIGVSPSTNFHVGGRMMLDNGVIQRGGTAITSTSHLGLYSRTSGDPIRFVTNAGDFSWYTDDDTGLATKMLLNSSGNLIVSNTLTVQSGGATVIGGMSVVNGGVTMSNALTVQSGGATITGGLTISNGSVTMSNALTVQSGGATITGSLSTTDAVGIRGTSPTVYLQDTDNMSAMLQCNSNVLYMMRGGVDSTTPAQINSQWPLTLNLGNNDCTVGGNVSAIQNVTAYASDQRLKSNVRILENAMEKVQRLRGVSFDWREDTPQPMRGHDIGLIAQDVESVLKEAVTLAPFDTDHETGSSKSGNHYLTVDIGNKLTALLIEAIKELSMRVRSLETKEK